jgi:GT2 family glycosyltransferase
MTLGRLSQFKIFPACLLNIADKFPPPSSSNSFSYLHLLPRIPLVSIVMPVFNSRWLKEAVESVLAQSYGNYELILVDDCSTLPAVVEILSRYEAQPKIKLIRNKKNLGISGATNVGIRAAAGEYLGFIDHDDLLHPDALAYFIRTLNDGQDPDVFYSNEAVINAEGVIIGKMLKCAPSMDLLLSCNSVLHFCIMKKSSLLKIGLLSSEYDGAQDHDLMIRAMENGLSFYHLPCFLYAWRAHHLATSGAVRAYNMTSGEEFPKPYRSGKKAIQAYLDRHGIKAKVTDDAFFWYRVKYELPAQQDEVAIIIPFRDQPVCLQRLLASLDKTAYRNFSVCLVNNGSRLPETAALIRQFTASNKYKTKVSAIDEPFNYSRLHNLAVAQLPNELLLFMNNDLEVIKPGWLEAMLEHIYRDKVGAVGCRLIRKDGEIQHAGMTFKPDIYFCAMNLNHEEGYYTKVQREVSAATCACMLIRKSVFNKIGGFDEIHFPIGFSDADLCLKIKAAGYKIIYTPFAELYHHESLSRKTSEESYEKSRLFKRYIGTTLLVDEHYKQG